MKNTDEEIIREICQGNTRRFGLLVDRHRHRAFTLAFRLVGERREAEELVQDAFVRVFQHVGDFRNESAFGTWLYRIVYNLCMTKVTRRKGTPQLLDIQDENLSESIPADPDDLSVQGRLEQEEVQSLLAAEIENLPEHFRAAITLFYVQEMKYEQIAEIMEVPVGTVKTYLFRGRTRLRQRIIARLSKEVHAA